jgi:hypothetical protein
MRSRQVTRPRLSVANHNLPDQALGDGLGSKAGGREDVSDRGGTRLLASAGFLSCRKNERGVVMSEEYGALRAEILRWQDRRFDLLKISISVVTGLLGLKLIFEVSGSSGTLWPFVSSTLLLYLAAANLIIWYAGVSNSILAAYVKVFHEENESTSVHWETRFSKLKKCHNLNHWIAVLHSALAIICVALPYAATTGLAGPSPWLLGLVAGSAAVFLTTMFVVMFFSYPRERYETDWRRLRDEEKKP